MKEKRLEIIKDLDMKKRHITIADVKLAQEELCKLEGVEVASVLYMVLDDLDVICGEHDSPHTPEEHWKRIDYVFKGLQIDITNEGFEM